MIVLLAVGAVPLAAQDSAATLLRMEARLDSLTRAAAVRRSAAARTRINDTVVVGGLRVATSAPYRLLVQAAADKAWRSLLTRFGPTVVEPAVIPVVPFGATGIPVRTPSAVAELAQMFERISAVAIWQQRDPPLTAWLRGNVPGDPVTSRDLGSVAEQLAGRPARPNIACLQGDAPKCAAALGIGIGVDTLGEWYPPSTWPKLAFLIGGGLSRADLVSRQSCMNRGDLAACRSVLTPVRLLPPVGIEGRRYLVQLALEAGGDSAFHRLTQDTSLPIESRLAAAAGVPVRTLLVQWVAAVQRAMPRGPTDPLWESLVSMVWSIAILTLALRGSRWW
ncbi:MAG: hypothetical protein E4H41_01180 [Gemmatimonadales bacterium]|nr:MAG: hypothetical protein E4H41_01180 [Gemmatimonadales bacterium]